MRNLKPRGTSRWMHSARDEGLKSMEFSREDGEEAKGWWHRVRFLYTAAGVWQVAWSNALSSRTTMV